MELYIYTYVCGINDVAMNGINGSSGLKNEFPNKLKSLELNNIITAVPNG